MFLPRSGSEYSEYVRQLGTRLQSGEFADDANSLKVVLDAVQAALTKKITTPVDSAGVAPTGLHLMPADQVNWFKMSSLTTDATNPQFPNIMFNILFDQEFAKEGASMTLLLLKARFRRNASLFSEADRENITQMIDLLDKKFHIMRQYKKSDLAYKEQMPTIEAKMEELRKKYA